MLRLRNTSYLRFSDDQIGGRLSDAVIESRAERMQAERRKREDFRRRKGASNNTVADETESSEMDDGQSQGSIEDLRFYSGPGAMGAA